MQASNYYCISFCSLLPCTPVLSSGPSADITYLSVKRGQAEISHLCLLTKLFGLSACSVYRLNFHVLHSKLFVYSSLTLGQQNGHFLCICVFVCVCGWQQFPPFLWWPHAMWEEVSPSIIDCADWVKKPLSTPASVHIHHRTFVMFIVSLDETKYNRYTCKTSPC